MRIRYHGRSFEKKTGAPRQLEALEEDYVNPMVAFEQLQAGKSSAKIVNLLVLTVPLLQTLKSRTSIK